MQMRRREKWQGSQFSCPSTADMWSRKSCHGIQGGHSSSLPSLFHKRQTQSASLISINCPPRVQNYSPDDPTSSFPPRKIYNARNAELVELFLRSNARSQQYGRAAVCSTAHYDLFTSHHRPP